MVGEPLAAGHTRGEPVVYCATNPATALLEILVHAGIDLENMPVHLRYLEISVPDTAAAQAINKDTLREGWPSRIDETRRAGDEWLRAGRTALLLVPSVIVPATWNVLINPRHVDAAQIRIVLVHEHPMDPRLWR